MEVTPVEAVSDDDIDPAAGDEEIGNDELILDIHKQEVI